MRFIIIRFHLPSTVGHRKKTQNAKSLFGCVVANALPDPDTVISANPHENNCRCHALRNVGRPYAIINDNNKILQNKCYVGIYVFGATCARSSTLNKFSTFCGMHKEFHILLHFTRNATNVKV